MLARPSLFLIGILALAPLAGFLPQSLGSRTPQPMDRRPTWAHLVVVTCDRIPADVDVRGAGFETLERRGARAALSAPELADPAVAAASLWTGRRMCPSEIERHAGALPWSLPCAAQRTGAVGAAFLERPLVSQARLSGFSAVIEDPELGPEALAELAGQHLGRVDGKRKVLWLHLSDAGERGERLDALLSGVHRAIESSGHGWDTLLLATALGAEPGAEIPLWAELPSDMLAGRQGRGSADPAEIACVLLDLLRLPRPDVTRGEAPVEASADLAILLRGGTVEPPRAP